jgi:hypothetical protein
MRIEFHTQRDDVLAQPPAVVVDAGKAQYRQGPDDDVVANAMQWVLARVHHSSFSWSHLARNGEVGLGATHRGEQHSNTHPKEDSWLPKQN